MASPTPAAAPSAAIERAGRMNAANMVRSLLPLVVICLLIAAWTAFRQSGDTGVRTVDPSTTVQLAAARASYPLLAPDGLEEGFRPTSARTDAGDAQDGDPVTLEIGYLTPGERFAGFVVSDDRRAEPLADVLDGAREEGAVDIGGRTWTRSTTEKGETALSVEVAGAVVVVFGSAGDDELETVAAAVEPYND
ncbi:DUF4245 domain-containing protein [Blastococcus sp. PRF04-17]|uniref:DUF4245 domain-containing protein n=1 Tax=Blastococcus sp. PRF04-17 TaxID=2933797 RepID=UPI001FF50354|nr:DUF4245 domain-containing protein [Blastococcus sp. PRF04-17]UOY03894.1 DUF4245 domain-containing protein [Blastococcus sp. PRF04-17]